MRVLTTEGIEIDCTPAEFAELRRLGMIGNYQPEPEHYEEPENFEEKHQDLEPPEFPKNLGKRASRQHLTFDLEASVIEFIKVNPLAPANMISKYTGVHIGNIYKIVKKYGGFSKIRKTLHLPNRRGHQVSPRQKAFLHYVATKGREYMVALNLDRKTAFKRAADEFRAANP